MAAVSSRLPLGRLRTMRVCGQVAKRQGWAVVPFPALGAVRRVRSGFFAEDPDFIDPELPLLSERIGSRWRTMDCPTLESPVLGRENVGMGILVLNRPRGLDLPTINTVYTRLRNLEVNTLKRFVGLTAMDPGPFCDGLNPKELLLSATAGRKQKRLPRFARALLWHHQELAHLVADYRKPVVCQLSGFARDGGAALGSLASFSGVHEDSEVTFDACFAGITPAGGSTYVLASMPWHLGEFMALTGWTLKGADLVYCGLARHWLSPDALPFMELTAEKHLEVSETDSRSLLDEHSLALPAGLSSMDVSQCTGVDKELIPIIDRIFNQEDIKQVREELKKVTETAGLAKEFAAKCLQKMEQANPTALAVTHQMIKLARKDIEAQPKPRAPLAPGHHGRHGPLAEALRRELRALERLMTRDNAVKGLHARCMGEAPPAWDRTINQVLQEDVVDLLSEPTPGQQSDFVVEERSEVSLSSHPKLRRYHPDYNPKTGLDHDHVWMAQEVRRWSPDLFEDARRRTVEELLGKRDLAAVGLSRWTPVDQL
eukprot:TRINITY_DN22359_c0_g1_i2.p1 TRINITY_DN22359_c0_g1~~TRINITY_DN22359_c0_g1_i2.p1  ORF type:complete len:543 (-),score=103.59 TRINITY_DN22359_c0_g1_i2:192-1820(-)